MASVLLPLLPAAAHGVFGSSSLNQHSCLTPLVSPVAGLAQAEPARRHEQD